MSYLIRRLEVSDYHRGYLNVLGQLSSITEEITFEQFERYYNCMQSPTEFDKKVNHRLQYHLYVVIDELKDVVIGCGTLLIEDKVIHNFGRVGHIEDIVVDNKYRGKGLGRIIIENLTDASIKMDCYKTILDCSESNETFYEKCGFSKKGLYMAIYHHK